MEGSEVRVVFHREGGGHPYKMSQASWRNSMVNRLTMMFFFLRKPIEIHNPSFETKWHKPSDVLKTYVSHETSSLKRSTNNCRLWKNLTYRTVVPWKILHYFHARWHIAASSFVFYLWDAFSVLFNIYLFWMTLASLDSGIFHHHFLWCVYIYIHTIIHTIHIIYSYII